MWLEPAQRLAPDAERARYDLHENDPEDPAYVGFLRRLADPMMERLKAGARGLDFGCGPVPALAAIMTDAGFPCAAYDPYFFPDDRLLADTYDYIACSEVVEHSYDPAATFALLQRLLAPEGLLGVMTRFRNPEAAFSEWWYRRDPTHVCFFAESTMRWIARRHGWEIVFPRPDVALFRDHR